ncbi:MAG: hypothetical protein IID08_04210 [Candidatus Hydrogenedentes bacterium]|nr:hypothetical protein [Candidatus Hydrogenedentota bacterium]
MNRYRYGLVCATGTIMALVADAHRAWACAVCFGAADDAQTLGMNMAIATMLSVTGVVLGLIASVGVMVWRRTLALDAQHDETGDESSPALPNEVPDA